MKFVFCFVGILLYVVILCFSSLGLAVHRVHATSVAREIVKSESLRESDTGRIEKLVNSTGNAKFYYSAISKIALFGIVANVVLIGYWLYANKIGLALPNPGQQTINKPSV